jgi:hypothetical protein
MCVEQVCCCLCADGDRVPRAVRMRICRRPVVLLPAGAVDCRCEHWCGHCSVDIISARILVQPLVSHVCPRSRHVPVHFYDNYSYRTNNVAMFIMSSWWIYVYQVWLSAVDCAHCRVCENSTISAGSKECIHLCRCCEAPFRSTHYLVSAGVRTRHAQS